MEEREFQRLNIIATELRPLLERAEPKFKNITDREIWKKWALHLFPGCVWKPLDLGFLKSCCAWFESVASKITTRPKKTSKAVTACIEMCYDVHHADSSFRRDYEYLPFSALSRQPYDRMIADIASRVYMSQDDLPQARISEKMESINFTIVEGSECIVFLTSGRQLIMPLDFRQEDIVLQPYSYTEYI